MVVGGTKLRVVSLFAAKWLPLQTRSGVGGGLGHLLECLFFPAFLISPEWSEDGFLLSGTTVQSETVTNQRLRNSSQSSLMNAL